MSPHQRVLSWPPKSKVTAPHPFNLVFHVLWHHVIDVFFIFFSIFPYTQPKWKPPKRWEIYSNFFTSISTSPKQGLAYGRKHVDIYELTDIVLSSLTSEVFCWGGGGFKALTWRWELISYYEFTLDGMQALYVPCCWATHVRSEKGQCHWWEREMFLVRESNVTDYWCHSKCLTTSFPEGKAPIYSVCWFSWY